MVEEGSANGHGGAVVGGLAMPVVAAVPVLPVQPVVANGGGGMGGGRVGEKLKFTVSVRGHQWSSARHVNETLQEFAAAIQRNARRLEFIEEDDSIQRLQLAYGDGSDPEDLDVDATLGDVIICMSDKQLIAIVNSTRGITSPCNPPPSANDAANLLGADAGIVHHTKLKNKSINTAAPNGYVDCPIDGRMPIEPKFRFPPYKPPANRAAPKCNIEPSRALKTAIPPQTDPGAAPPLSFHHDNVDRGCAGFHSDSLPPLGPSRSNVGNVAMAGCKQGRHSHGQASSRGGDCPKGTPSLAELANMLVRFSFSSDPHRVAGMQQQPGASFDLHGSVVGGTGLAMAGAGHRGGQRSDVASPASSGGFQCPHGTSTSITLLAQFLAWQLRAFVPVESSRGAAHPIDPSPLPCRENKAAATVSAKDPMNVSSGGAVHNPPPYGSHGRVATPENENVNSPNNVVENGSAPKNVKLSVSGSLEKPDESSSSANVNNATVNAPTGDVVDSGHPNGRNELVFLVNRRSKTGVGTHRLRMSDLSTYFHLSVVDTAKKLGVSQTTLKKACRKFGLKRWPGRKVRSLESTIHGLEHTIAVGQGAGLEELTEAYMRNEVQKLQQEMDQLVHGTPAQHSPAVRTADLYKRLYSRGWRSKYHSAGRHDLDLNAGSHENRPSALGPQSAKNATDTTRVVNPAVNRISSADQTKQRQKQKPAKDEPVLTQTTETCSKQGSEYTVLKDVDIEGLLREPIKEDLQTEKESTEREAIVEEKEITFPERSPKRPKRECRTVAEAAVRQSSRSSTCAIIPTGTIKYVVPKLELEGESDYV